jgi:ribonuclease-3
MNNYHFETLEETIQYRFRSRSLLIEALTHPSAISQVVGEDHQNYERLEFLGDTILNFIISEMLLSFFSEKEGILAKRRAHLVCKETLALIANNIHLGDFIIMAKGEEESLGRQNEANLENVLEALIAAIYLDSNIDTVKSFIMTFWGEHLDDKLNLNSDPKSSVQEWAQKNGKPIPEYITIAQEGKSHSPMFEIELRIEGEVPIRAQGTSKKRAEKEAARAFLAKYNLGDELLK